MRSKKKYTHVFFDLDNTLWDFEKNSKLAMEATFQLHQDQLRNIDFEPFFEVYLKHNKLLWSLYRKKQVGKKELTRRRFQNTFEELAISGIDPEEMNVAYLNEMPNFNELTAGSLEILDYLKSKNYQLYIITNGFKEVQLKKLKSAGLETYFSKVFISEVIKTPKPGREIFEYAVKSANAKKTNSIMIGDNQEVDVAGALHYGIDAVYFNPGETGKSSEMPVKKGALEVYFIKSMKELQNIL